MAENGAGDSLRKLVTQLLGYDYVSPSLLAI